MPELPPGEYVKITVQDSGIGMDAQTISHIFEPFFTTKQVSQGTGLGLSTVYGAVKQNGGHILVSSKPQCGTVFSIYLPRSLDTAFAETPTPPPSLKANGETVLLVEDESSVLYLTQRALEKYGYNTLTASSTRDALEVAQNYDGPIHLLFTDVVMPGINGPALYEKVKLIRPEIKVLYMSGYTADTLNNHGVSNTNPNFLQKPFSIKLLIGKIREQLDQE